ncbi:hypothetical protein O9993_16920 [Vibrio lentus]|nr:hypothetical protein [Vibrio lentus]
MLRPDIAKNGELPSGMVMTNYWKTLAHTSYTIPPYLGDLEHITTRDGCDNSLAGELQVSIYRS